MLSLDPSFINVHGEEKSCFGRKDLQTPYHPLTTMTCSYPFTPIATPTIGGTAFDLAYGLNGNVKVYSFVAHSHAATTFSGNLVSPCSASHPRDGVADCMPAQFLPVP